MKQSTIRQMMLALQGGDPAEQVRILFGMVTDLMVEVEALREALIQLDPETRGSRVRGGYDISCHDESLADGKGPYPQAYINTAYLSHNAAGPSPGVEKLLARFYPDDRGTAEERSWRETLMLRRLGFSSEEIAKFRAAAEEAECFT